MAIKLSMIVVITSWAPTAAFRYPGDPAPDEARAGRGEEREEDVQRPAACPRGASRRRARRQADRELALAADVEHPAPEGERDRERRQHQRCGDDQRLLEVACRPPGAPANRARVEDVVEPRALEDRLVGAERVMPCERRRRCRRPRRRARSAASGIRTPPMRVENHAWRICAHVRLASGGAGGGVSPRGSPVVGASPIGRYAAVRSRFPPVISIPSSSSVTSGPCSPTIRPS